VTPYAVDELALGPAVERTIIAFHGAVPPPLEDSQGFRIGWLVSHGFFRPYAVTFDFDAMKLRLRRAGDSAVSSFDVSSCHRATPSAVQRRLPPGSTTCRRPLRSAGRASQKASAEGARIGKVL
jgi:hypothetical protein